MGLSSGSAGAARRSTRVGGRSPEQPSGGPTALACLRHGALPTGVDPAGNAPRTSSVGLHRPSSYEALPATLGDEGSPSVGSRQDSPGPPRVTTRGSTEGFAPAHATVRPTRVGRWPSLACRAVRGVLRRRGPRQALQSERRERVIRIRARAVHVRPRLQSPPTRVSRGQSRRTKPSSLTGEDLTPRDRAE